METLQRVDEEFVKVIRTEPLTLDRVRAVADITEQTEQGLALFKERVRVAKEQMRLALQLTQPGQWMTYGDGEKQSVYCTAGAGDRILRMGFGMRWGPKTVTIERDATSVTAIAQAELLKHDGTVYEAFEGRRRMVFNEKNKGGVEGYIKDESNLIKSALANLVHTAVTAIMGFRFLSPADFRELGLDLSKITRHVDFEDNTGHDEPVLKYGKDKGKPISQVGDENIDWYIQTMRDNIADPTKEKWKADGEKKLALLLAVKAQRAPKGERV